MNRIILGISLVLAALSPAANAMDDMMPMGNTPSSPPGQMSPAPPPSGMPMPGGAPSGGMGMGMCMECMGEMGSMGSASAPGGMAAVPPNALPGFPGASHLYHVGAEGFFLNHPQHIQLSTEQQTRLGRIREKALLDRATAQRKIDDAEQQLFVLTGSDQPDMRKIEAQARTIEELNVQRRLTYIRAVGEAAQVLTEQQRGAVLGTAP
jgi:Spy/CpxP family protein refolding chaperone